MIMNFKFIKHDQCTEELIKDICRLKKQHWDYPIKEQKKWIAENIGKNDIHLLLRNDENILIGYLSLVKVEVFQKEDLINMFGIGSVSVDKTHLGEHLGLLLMNLVNFYLRKQNKQGILLCGDKLTNFYIKCGWNLFKGNVYHKDSIFEDNTLFSERKVWDEVNISKLF